MKKGLWVLLLVLSACASNGGNGERYWLKSEEMSWHKDDAVSLLHYATYARGLNSSERERELERQRSAYAREKSHFRRVQYALLLATPDASASERKLALQLLEPVLDGKQDGSLLALAAMLAAHLGSVSSAYQQGQQHGQQSTQKRVDELEKKLDAVKDIERSLLRREKGKP